MSDVQYRPARIQTLSPEQEIVLKQTWGYLLKYWGYELSITSGDLGYKEAFCASSTSAAHTSHWAGETAVAASAAAAKKKGFFRGGETLAAEPEKPATSSKRVQKVAAKRSEKYVPMGISEQHRYTYMTHYAQGVEFSKNYDSDGSTASSRSGSDSGHSLETMATNLTLVDEKDGSGGGAAAPTNKKGGGLSTKARTSVLPLFKPYNPQEIHSTFWKNQRADLLDNWILKFVRARNFETEKALTMFTTDLEWRTNQSPAYEWLLEGDGPSATKGINPGLIKNFTVNKAWIHGFDKKDNVIFMFRAALHLGGDAPQEEMRRWCVLAIEWTRYFMRDITRSTDQSSVVFDLTGFSLKNADYVTIKFIADVFEAHYPECLANIFVYNAPWVFSKFWNIIKHWLDPVVSSKIRFVKDLEEIGEYIEVSELPVFMGGTDEYTSNYTPPKSEAEYMTKPKDATFQKLIHERDELNLQLLERTARWIESYDPVTSSKYLQDKIDVATKLASNHVSLDPYVRKRGPQDRNGTLKVSLY
ncbi:phosphatidylinositol transfer protein Csr1p [[Candida] anglica]